MKRKRKGGMLSVGDSVFLPTQLIFFMEWDEKVSKAIWGGKGRQSKKFINPSQIRKKSKISILKNKTKIQWWKVQCQ